MFAFSDSCYIAVSRVFSGKPSIYPVEAKTVHKWFTASISLQIMLMDSSHALRWMLFFVFLQLEDCHCLDHCVQILSTRQESVALYGPSVLSDVPSPTCRSSKYLPNLDLAKKRPAQSRMTQRSEGLVRRFDEACQFYRQLVHHTHEYDAVGVVSGVHSFRQLWMKHVVLSAPASASRSPMD